VAAVFDHLQLKSRLDTCQTLNPWRELTTKLLRYFQRENEKTGRNAQNSNVHLTAAAPIYLQWKGHSVTVVGIMKDTIGINLIVFDPDASPYMVKKDQVHMGFRSILASERRNLLDTCTLSQSKFEHKVKANDRQEGFTTIWLEPQSTTHRYLRQKS
jgi:hypothetical protein